MNQKVVFTLWRVSNVFSLLWERYNSATFKPVEHQESESEYDESESDSGECDDSEYDEGGIGGLD